MSGQKDSYVNLRQSEYNRLMSACSRIDNVEKNVQESLSRQRQQINKDIENRMQAVNNRFNMVDSQISRMSQDMRRIEQEQNENLRRQAEAFKGAMQRQRQELLNEINRQRAEIMRAMEEQRKNLQGQITQIEENLKQKEANQRKMAEIWLNDAQALLDEIDSKYRHEKFIPGEMSNLMNMMSMGNSNLKNEVYQSAISSAQKVYLDANNLRANVMMLELEWESYLTGAKLALSEAIAEVEAQDKCMFSIETEEGNIEVHGNIDYWTCGGLTKIKEEIKGYEQRLSRADDLTTLQLQQIIRELENLKQQCSNLADYAKQAQIASQLRVTIADNILRALETAGWQLDDSTYSQEKQTEAYHLKLNNGIGEEIVAIITPEHTENQTIRNKLNINFFDPNTNDEKSREDSLKYIMSTLEENGLECSTPKCRPGTANSPCKEISLLDFERVRIQKPSNIQQTLR